MDACTAELTQLDALEPDLLVVLGGPIGAYDAAVYPFLTAEIALLRRRLEAKRPLVGICLGAQLMATALGAAVYPGKQRQGNRLGADQRRRRDRRLSGGRGAAGAGARGAALARRYLRSAHRCRAPGSIGAVSHQAFAIGPQALALQFHPEVRATALERWYVGHACELGAAHIDVAQLRAASARHAPLLEEASRRFWRRWLEAAGA